MHELVTLLCNALFTIMSVAASLSSSSSSTATSNVDPRSRVASATRTRDEERRWRDVSRQVGVILTHQIFMRASRAAQVTHTYTHTTVVINPDAPFRFARTVRLTTVTTRVDERITTIWYHGAV